MGKTWTKVNLGDIERVPEGESRIAGIPKLTEGAFRYVLSYRPAQQGTSRPGGRGARAATAAARSHTAARGGCCAGERIRRVPCPCRHQLGERSRPRGDAVLSGPGFLGVGADSGVHERRQHVPPGRQGVPYLPRRRRKEDGRGHRHRRAAQDREASSFPPSSRTQSRASRARLRPRSSSPTTAPTFMSTWISTRVPSPTPGRTRTSTPWCR